MKCTLSCIRLHSNSCTSKILMVHKYEQIKPWHSFLDALHFMLWKVTYLDCIFYMWDEHYCDINTHLCNSRLICHDILRDKSDVSHPGTGYVILHCKRFIKLINYGWLFESFPRSILLPILSRWEWLHYPNYDLGNIQMSTWSSWIPL